MIGNEAFSSIDLVGQCLIDHKRTNLFRKAIEKNTRDGMKVLDVGTGSGIMAMLAARHNKTGRTYAIEFDPYISNIAKKNIEINNLNNSIELITGDARNHEYKVDKFDLVIMEMLTTGMVDEYQIQALNNLFEQNVVDSSTIFIPKMQKTYFTLINFNFNVEGFNFPMITHLWNEFHHESNEIISLTDRQILNEIKLNTLNDINFKHTFKIKILNDGIINSIYLESDTVLDENIILGYTPSLNGQVIIPIEERCVKKGETVEIKVDYIFGGGYDVFNTKYIN